jgi:anti-anti-sigma factor
MEFVALNQYSGSVAVDGVLDADREELLMQITKDAAQRGMKNIVFDFRPLDHMNSAGASVLVKLATTSKKRQLRLSAFGLGRRYREVFRLTGLAEEIDIVDEKSTGTNGLSDDALRTLKESAPGADRQDDSGWSPSIDKLKITERPEGAMNKNMDGRRVIGPLQGFGPMWQKTYLLPIDKPGLQPQEVMDIMKGHFPEFQPPENDFYPTSRGIAPGEAVLIDSATPGGIVSTGVLVLYADDVSFTLITPEGHPEAGWVTFSVRKSGNSLLMQIQGLARASDPIYELAFRIVGSKLQESIWRHVLSSLASHLEVAARVDVVKTCFDDGLQWRKTGNIWYNAQIRSLPYNVLRLFQKPKRRSR